MENDVGVALQNFENYMFKIINQRSERAKILCMDAEDVAQEVRWLVLSRFKPGKTYEETCNTLHSMIPRYVATTLRSKRKEYSHTFRKGDDYLARVPDTEDEPSKRTFQEMVEESGVPWLPLHQGIHCLMLRELGYSNKEIGATLGMNSDIVHNACHRGRIALSRHIKRHLDGELVKQAPGEKSNARQCVVKGVTYGSLSAAAEDIGCTIPALWRICKKRQKTLKTKKHGTLNQEEVYYAC